MKINKQQCLQNKPIKQPKEEKHSPEKVIKIVHEKLFHKGKIDPNAQHQKTREQTWHVTHSSISVTGIRPNHFYEDVKTGCKIMIKSGDKKLAETYAKLFNYTINYDKSGQFKNLTPIDKNKTH